MASKKILWVETDMSFYNLGAITSIYLLIKKSKWKQWGKTFFFTFLHFHKKLLCLGFLLWFVVISHILLRNPNLLRRHKTENKRKKKNAAKKYTYANISLSTTQKLTQKYKKRAYKFSLFKQPNRYSSRATLVYNLSLDRKNKLELYHKPG